MAHKTAIDSEGVFYLRPLFMDDYGQPKFGLLPKNYKIRYETYYNEKHLDYNNFIVNNVDHRDYGNTNKKRIDFTTTAINRY